MIAMVSPCFRGFFVGLMEVTARGALLMSVVQQAKICLVGDFVVHN